MNEGSQIPEVTAGVVGFDLIRRLCGPAADEIGLMLRDHVRLWRMKNWVRLQKRALQFLEKEGLHSQSRLHPRLMFEIIEKGTLTEDDLLIDMWAGLLAASCTEKGGDDSNLVFTDILARMTSFEAKLLQDVCLKAPEMYDEKTSFINAGTFLTEKSKLSPHDPEYLRVNGALYHLTSMGLFRIVPTAEAGVRRHVSTKGGLFEITTLGLELYARCQGWKGTISEFYKIEVSNGNLQIP